MDKLVKRNTDCKNLLIYRKADIIFLMTNVFVERFVSKFSRTRDQMIQAARSGKQNIVEGMNDLETSKDTGINLINVAKGSLLELLEDYEDYLKTNNGEKWEKDDEKTLAMRRFAVNHEAAEDFLKLMKTRDGIVCANIMIVLIKQLDYLFYKFIQSLSEKFLKEGGFKEKMHRMRIDRRNGR